MLVKDQVVTPESELVFMGVLSPPCNLQIEYLI